MALALGGEGEEARTAAVQAVRLIEKHGLLADGMRPRKEILAVADDLSDELIRIAYEFKGDWVQVADVVRGAIKIGTVRPSEFKLVCDLLRIRARRLRDKGVLVGRAGAGGGYAMPADVRRKIRSRRAS